MYSIRSIRNEMLSTLNSGTGTEQRVSDSILLPTVHSIIHIE